MSMPRHHHGFTYIGLLLMVALITAGLASIGEAWRTMVQRSKEAELLFIGEQFRHAIKRYYEATPGADKQLPKSLEDLLRDPRYPVVRRYLRKVFVDPMMGKTEWGLIREKDGIIGVHSLSTDVPFKQRGGESDSLRRATYAEWKFIADVTVVVAPAVTVKPAPAAPQTTNAPAPAAVPVEEAPVPAPIAPTPKPRVKPPTEPCERLRFNDNRICAASTVRLGRPDTACEQSAATRYANCSAGVTAGPLYLEQ